MASAGTSAAAPVAPITVTQTKGYDWTLSVRKAVHAGVGGLLTVAGSVAAICLASDEVRAALIATVPASWGIVGKAAAPALILAAWKFTENWQKHKGDIPVEITAVPLVEAGK